MEKVQKSINMRNTIIPVCRVRGDDVGKKSVKLKIKTRFAWCEDL